MADGTKEKNLARPLPSRKVSRRRFMVRSGATVSGALLFRGSVLAENQGRASPPGESVGDTAGSASRIQLTVNGLQHELEVAHHLTLAEVLRDQLGLTGVKIGCNRGECGACTILLDGKAVYSCSLIAALVDGSKITTIEGLANGEELHPLQQAFMDHDGLQCGFCTPGQIMAAKALLEAHPAPSEAQVRRALSGNLCRCACYSHIVAAVLDVAGRSGRGA